VVPMGRERTKMKPGTGRESSKKGQYTFHQDPE
jgi:hypothetical protein